MKPRFRFTLRFVLLVVLVVACLFAIWRARPTNPVLVTLDATGRLQLDGRELSRVDLPAALNHQSVRRRFWWVEPQLHIQVASEVKAADVIEIVTMGQQAGFESVSFAEASD